MRTEEFVVHLTYQCPLTCSHCCFSSDMSKSGNLSLEQVLQAIEEASRIKTVRKIEFVGGDPFLHCDILEKACAHATSLGLASAAVTSAYWAGSYDRALRTLRPIADAGLSLITLSYDDMHAEFVKSKTIVNAYRAARLLDVKVKIAITLQPGSMIDRDFIINLLDAGDDPGLVIYETFINSTGRALDGVDKAKLKERRSNERVYLGACSSVLRHVSLTAEGHLMSCCGVLPYRQALSIGEFGQQPVDEAVRDAFANPVLNWLAFEGPVEILKQITRHTAQPLEDGDFDGICHACDVLFSNPLYAELLEAALPAKLASLAVQQTVYELAELYEKPVPPRTNPHPQNTDRDSAVPRRTLEDATGRHHR